MVVGWSTSYGGGGRWPVNVLVGCVVTGEIFGC